MRRFKAIAWWTTRGSGPCSVCGRFIRPMFAVLIFWADGMRERRRMDGGCKDALLAAYADDQAHREAGAA